jgi:hypothetical protein
LRVNLVTILCKEQQINERTHKFRVHFSIEFSQLQLFAATKRYKINQNASGDITNEIKTMFFEETWSLIKHVNFL